MGGVAPPLRGDVPPLHPGSAPHRTEPLTGVSDVGRIEESLTAVKNLFGTFFELASVGLATLKGGNSSLANRSRTTRASCLTLGTSELDQVMFCDEHLAAPLDTLKTPILHELMNALARDAQKLCSDHRRHDSAFAFAKSLDFLEAVPEQLQTRFLALGQFCYEREFVDRCFEHHEQDKPNLVDGQELFFTVEGNYRGTTFPTL